MKECELRHFYRQHSLDYLNYFLVLNQAEQNIISNVSQLEQAGQAKGDIINLPSQLPYTALDFTPQFLLEGTEEATGEEGGGEELTRPKSPEPTKKAGGGAKVKLFKSVKALVSPEEKADVIKRINQLATETGFSKEFIKNLPFRYNRLLREGKTKEAQELLKSLELPSVRRYTIDYAGRVQEYEEKEGAKALTKIRIQDLPPKYRIKAELKQAEFIRKQRESSQVSTESRESGVGSSVASEASEKVKEV